MTNNIKLNILQAIEKGTPFTVYGLGRDINNKIINISHVEYSHFISQVTIMKIVYPNLDRVDLEKEKASISIMLKRILKRGLIKKGRPVWTPFYWDSFGDGERHWTRSLRGIV